MKTLFNIENRNFTSLEFAQKFADSKGLDYSLITEKRAATFDIPKTVFIGKESQERYNERRAYYAR